MRNQILVGLSHVSSQPAIIPSSRSMLSRDKPLPQNTWNSSRLQEHVFGDQFSTLINFEIILKELIQSGELQRESGSVP